MDSQFLRAVRRSVVSGGAFFLTVVGLSAVSAGLSSGLSSSDLKGANDPLSSAAWNRVVNSALELDGKISALLPGNGKLSLTGAVKIGNDTAPCDADNRWTVRYTGTTFEGCTPTGWKSLIYTTVEIVNHASGKRWADGTYAATCNAYRYPSWDYRYSGSTGDGVYTISPAGTPFDVYCDMTTDGGGWTKVAYSSTAVSLTSTAAVGTISSSAYKFSDTVIESVRSASTWWLFAGNVTTGAKMKLKSSVSTYAGLSSVGYATTSGCWPAPDGVNQIILGSPPSPYCWAYPTVWGNFYDFKTNSSGGNGGGVHIYLK